MYKDMYRPSAQAISDYSKLREAILFWNPYVTPIPDEMGVKFGIEEITNYHPCDLDFNDNFFCDLARRNKYIIVTDDADFIEQGDIEVVTLNSELLKRKSPYSRGPSV
jgi:hypothetical protein